MKFTVFSLLVCSLIISLSGCDNEDEDLNPRRAGDADNATINIYTGVVANAVGSLTDCPSGKTARLDVDFTANSILYTLPPGLNLFANLNTRFAEETGTRSLDQGTGAFSVVYTFADAAADFDTTACNDGGGYSNEVELSVSGTLSTDSTFVSEATSTISIRCITPGQIRSLCLGSFTGFSSVFN